MTNRKCFGYSGSGRGTRNGAVTEIVHAWSGQGLFVLYGRFTAPFFALNFVAMVEEDAVTVL